VGVELLEERFLTGRDDFFKMRLEELKLFGKINSTKHGGSDFKYDRKYATYLQNGSLTSNFPHRHTHDRGKPPT